jgi:Flp pilus assembly protein TadD
MPALLDVIGILFLFALTPFLVILVHELGHALMVLPFAKDNVNIYIGSFGKENNSVQIKTGRLITNIKKNPFRWVKGRCIPPSMKLSLNHQIILVAAGPFFSILSGLIALFIFQHTNPGGLRFELIFFGVYSVLIGLISLLPRTLSKRTDSGELVITDGSNLLQLFRLKFLPHEYTTATNLYNKQQYLESSNTLETIIESGNKNKHVLRLAINANLQAKNFKHCDELITVFLNKYLPNSDDYFNAGYIKSTFKNEEAAIALYKKSLVLNPDNALALNNVGHSLIELGRYSEAIQYLDAAISESPKLCHARCNLGLARMHLEDIESGLEAIQACLEIDPNFADAYTCLGIYNLKRGKLTEAKQCFEKSIELGSVDLINTSYLKEVEEIMSKDIT